MTSNLVDSAAAPPSQGDFELLETLVLTEGGFHHAAAHVDRMALAATHFGFKWEPAMVQQTLDGLRAAHTQGRWRVRLLLDRQGGVQAQAYPLPDTPATVRLQLAPRPLPEAHGEFVRHKTTRRAHYEAFAPTDPRVFDTVLWNTDGEVTECTRGNLALLFDGDWVTPATGSGLLPGIERAHWLGQGRVREAVVRLTDLPDVQALAFINSLRGWVDAAWDRPLTELPAPGER